MKPDELKKIRLWLGLSVAQAANQVHITDRSWRRYEKGDRQIPKAIVHLFCTINNLPYPPNVDSL